MNRTLPYLAAFVAASAYSVVDIAPAVAETSKSTVTAKSTAAKTRSVFDHKFQIGAFHDAPARADKA